MRLPDLTSVLILAAALPLAACGEPDPNVPGNGTMSMDVPGFKASITLPDLGDIQAGMDIDGLKLHPGTKIGGMQIAADDKTGGVTMDFAAPAAPAAVIDYYADAGKNAGFAIPARGANTITLTKSDDTLVVTTRPGKGGGSFGTLSIKDQDK
jgi:hypothetical protein